MKYVKTSVFAVAGVLITLILPISTHAQKDVKVTNSPSEPVPVTGTVSVGNVVEFKLVIPVGAFSKRTTELGLFQVVSGPDTEGTSYAITSMTVTNRGSATTAASLNGMWGNTNDCIAFDGLQVSLGPIVELAPGQTIHLSFPQPFVLSAKPGAVSCLRGNSLGATFTVVGYRF